MRRHPGGEQGRHHDQSPAASDGIDKSGKYRDREHRWIQPRRDIE
jgi:hypothetical protein